MGFFFWRATMTDQERIKRLEEDVAWLQKDIRNLIGIVEALQKPEIHTYFTMITENVTYSVCQNTNDLNEFI